MVETLTSTNIIMKKPNYEAFEMEDKRDVPYEHTYHRRWIDKGNISLLIRSVSEGTCAEIGT